MALNFSISYTFSPSTTISSSQVNTNESDIAAVFTGLEAETKTLSKLKMDSDPTLALEVATKQYVDHYSTWRRPVLQWLTVTTVGVESGLDGTSGDIPILFPDGTIRTETSATRTTFDITRNAVLVTSGAQSGLTGATSEANDTWYALYAVKVTDSSTLWVTVGSTALPLRANFATLNTAYGTNGWVYLGLIRNGDSDAASGDIVRFYMSGNITQFFNALTNSHFGTYPGLLMATSAGATSLTWTTSGGTTDLLVPNNVTFILTIATADTGSTSTTLTNLDGSRTYRTELGTSRHTYREWVPVADGVKIVNASSVAMDIINSGFIDGTLGVGSNPLL